MGENFFKVYLTPKGQEFLKFRWGFLIGGFLGVKILGLLGFIGGKNPEFFGF